MEPTLSEPSLPHPGLPSKPVTPSGIIVRGMFGGQTSEEWVAKYERSHQHPVNRLCHTYGIPTILISVAMFAAGFIRHRLWWWAFALFVFYLHAGLVEVLPQRWFTAAQYRVGQQWITRAVRDPESHRIVGECFGVGTFLLQEDGCRLERWVEKRGR